MPVKFSKCGKKAEDLLKKGYESKRTVTLKTKTKSGVTYKSKGVLGTSKDSKMAGSFEASYKHPSGFHIDKFAVSSAHQFDADISLNEQADGVKFTLGVTVQDFYCPGDKEKAEVGVEYANKAMNLMATAKMDPSNDCKSYMDLCLGYENFTMGASVAGILKEVKKDEKTTMKPTLTDYGAKIGYSMGKEAEMTLTGKKMFKNFTFGVLHNYSKAMTFATTVDYTPKDKKVGIKAGGKYCLDKETTFQAMVDGGANLSLSYSQYLRPMVKLTTSAKVDMKFVNDATAGGSNPTTFGCCLDLGDI